MTGAALVVGLGGVAQAEDKTKVGFVYVGPVGDMSTTKAVKLSKKHLAIKLRRCMWSQFLKVQTQNV